jgi:hypothetical protein
MDLKVLSKIKKNHFRVFTGILVVWVIFGCMEKPRVRVTEPTAPTGSGPSDKQPTPTMQEPDANVRAAAAMVRQGRQHLTRGEPDAAIRILERSVALDSRNGQNYYYLAEAWLIKKNAPQAREFNRLAGIQLAQDATWKTRIDRQKDRIDQLEK